MTASGVTCLAADVAAKAAFLLAHDGPDLARRARDPGPLRRAWTERWSSTIALERAMVGEPVVHLTSNPIDWYAARAAGHRSRTCC